MQPSSIGLAAAFALTLATLGPAHAGFVARAPHMIPPAHMTMANHIRQFERFGPRDSQAFRHGHEGQFSSIRHDRQFSSFGGGYFGSPDFTPAPDAQPPSFVAGAPVINVTIVTTAPGGTHSPPENYAASIRPKIILIGARPRATHFEKLPIVIYGRS